VKFWWDEDGGMMPFNRAANAVLSKVGATASEEVLVQLIKSICIPVLLYGCEAVGLSSRDMAALDLSFVRVIMKIFKCSNRAIINDVMTSFCISKPSEIIRRRADRFNVKYSKRDNSVCQSLILLMK
jgi:hypothetical protein